MYNVPLLQADLQLLLVAWGEGGMVAGVDPLNDCDTLLRAPAWRHDHMAAWQHRGMGDSPVLHSSQELTQRLWY